HRQLIDHQFRVEFRHGSCILDQSAGERNDGGGSTLRRAPSEIKDFWFLMMILSRHMRPRHSPPVKARWPGLRGRRWSNRIDRITADRHRRIQRSIAGGFESLLWGGVLIRSRRARRKAHNVITGVTSPL